MQRYARADNGQRWTYQPPNARPVHLAGEPVAVDIAEFVCSSHDRRAAIIPNREEHLHGHSWADGKNVLPSRDTNLGHNNDVLPRNVVFFECLSEYTLRISIRVHIGRVKGVDPVVVSVRGGGVSQWSTGWSKCTGAEDSRKLDMFESFLLAQHPFLPSVVPVAHAP
jgi:hypothetical protein